MSVSDLPRSDGEGQGSTAVCSGEVLPGGARVQLNPLGLYSGVAAPSIRDTLLLCAPPLLQPSVAAPQ